MQPLPTITWFEIPTSDFQRAIDFYQAVFKIELKTMEELGIAMALFPHAEGMAGGALVSGAPYQPSSDGVVIYLYSNDFDAALDRIECNGGKVVMPKTEIPAGLIALFIDSEGNRVGLHTIPQ
ncbi:VOC family protein [Halioxenophilus sp. WMMB6]|uniref:VOC family protein n=1 Tax=Halioxenophilus sp. WMMB6 TaxID=3073815 RepID=UPI00295E4F54|nr:VOC family protein [Halioxenophilus sp. WMMB6]